MALLGDCSRPAGLFYQSIGDISVAFRVVGLALEVWDVPAVVSFFWVTLKLQILNLCRSQKLLFLFFSHHIDLHIFDHNEQLSQLQEEDSTAAITKTTVNIQSEFWTFSTKLMLIYLHITFANKCTYLMQPSHVSAKFTHDYFNIIYRCLF